MIISVIYLSWCKVSQRIVFLLPALYKYNQTQLEILFRLKILTYKIKFVYRVIKRYEMMNTVENT